MIPLEQVSDFKRSLIQFTKVKAPVSFPETLDTSRYQFSLLSSYKVDGIYQLAEVDSSKILAIDRFSGDFFSFRLGGKTPDRKYLGNVFDSLGFLRNSSESIENYKIDKAGNRKSQNPKIFATAFDLDYAFNRVYLSITLPSDDQSCTSLQLYSFKLPTSSTNPIENVAQLFQSPCVLDKKNPTMWGGRITHSKSHLYLSIGDQRYDPSGFPKTDLLSIAEIDNSNSVFGKILKFTPGNVTYEIFSSGHRNAQGLFFSMDENILVESEHGPFGGDEVNFISRGKHYGWPFRTFGKPYGLFETGNVLDEFRSVNPSAAIDLNLAKFGASSGTHQGYQIPVYSWVPGIGASNIMQIQRDSSFMDWRSNLLVAGMVDGAMYRLILSKESVVATERIATGFRIRDFIVSDEGLLILSSDEGRLLFYQSTHPQLQN